MAHGLVGMNQALIPLDEVLVMLPSSIMPLCSKLLSFVFLNHFPRWLPVALQLSLSSANKNTRKEKLNCAPIKSCGNQNRIALLKMKTCNEWKPFIVMIAIDFSFAAVNILLKKVLEEGMNHLVFITYRLSISTIFIAPIAYFRERNDRPRLTFRILCYLFCSAIVGTSVTQYFFLLGIQYTSATFACAFINMVPVLTFVMALPFGLENVKIKCNSGRAKILGSLVCIGGALMLTLYKGKPLFNFSHYESAAPLAKSAVKLDSARTTERWTMGVIALVLGTVFWSFWFILQSKISKRYPCQYSSTAIMTFFGAIQSAIICLFTDHNLSIWVLKGKIQIIAILYAGMIGSGLCFVGMSWCVKKRGPVFTAAFSPLVQIMAAMIDIPVLHEELHLGSLLGSILVIIGLYILLWGKKMEMKNRVNKLVQEVEETKEPEPQPQIQQLTVHCVNCIFHVHRTTLSLHSTDSTVTLAMSTIVLLAILATASTAPPSPSTLLIV
ncbi:hypothetical protein Fmac_008935 [Flemingia macrophylla]|uniref:EamA domain-containing protein n=1 Tax=Flemingia macrophylla TaxID=520843 RepID=A0ABD1MYS9_9FABA